MTGMTARLERIVNLGSHFVRFVLLGLLVLLVIYNFNKVSRSIDRLQRLVVPGLVDITFRGIRISDTDSQEWATYYRVSEVEVVGANLGNNQHDPEWVEIRATNYPVDLAGGYIGDSNELRRIPKNIPMLQVGQCIRIVTSGNAPLNAGDTCVDSVRVETFGGKDSSSFLKKGVGKGDRIIVFDSSRRSLLDMDYWVTKASCVQ